MNAMLQRIVECETSNWTFQEKLTHFEAHEDSKEITSLTTGLPLHISAKIDSVDLLTARVESLVLFQPQAPPISNALLDNLETAAAIAMSLDDKVERQS